MREIILATNNPGKLREFNHAFAGTGIRFISLKDVPGAPDVEETGETYEENALLKAVAVAKYAGAPVVADDSGIEIKALPGELGVKSARYAAGRPYSEVNAEILERLEGEKLRACQYVAAIAYIDVEASVEKTVEGICAGMVHDKQEGDGGFGYDPIFYLPDFECTMAQLPLDIKNKISHRAKAIEGLKKILLSNSAEAL